MPGWFYYMYITWPIVYVAGPIPAQHWANVSCLLGTKRPNTEKELQVLTITTTDSVRL